MSTTADPATTAAAATTSTSTMDAATKLSKLRQQMAASDLDAYVIPTDDPHLSEYVPAAYMRRAFLTDFHGSAGTAIVTKDAAYLWTDSRYWNEANLQLDSDHWTLQKAGLESTPTIPKWLVDTAKEHYVKNNNSKPLKIGMDPFVQSASFVKEVETGLQEAAKEEGWGDDSTPGLLVTEHPNLIDPIWGDARPAIPTSPFRVHPIEYAGMTVSEKIEKIRSEMNTKKCTATVFSTLDDVAYLMNLRSKGDIDTCPVGIAYAMVTEDAIYLYCDKQKLVANEVQEHLRQEGVTVKPYDDIVSDIQAHCAADSANKTKVWLDKSRSNYAIATIIPDANLLDAQNAVTAMKACKNEAELKGMREAHIVDGVAMAHFMAWLEQQIVTEQLAVSEVEIDTVLTGYRAQQKGFMECSFPTIAGVGGNGAIIHYRAQENDLMKYLDQTAPILIDSGGQYAYGTTDVTRTWSFQSKPDPKFVECYTRVLKGNIGMDRMIFPEQTPGFVLDVYARAPLWQVGLNYGHGTGHGVGAALNVHEGPMSISPRYKNLEVLKKGMVVSNEPGYYEDGNFGVRIENLLEIQYVNPEDNDEKEGELAGSDEKKFLTFSKLTMIPIQKNLIDLSLMSDDELDWLDNYHAEVLDKVGSRLDKDSPAMAWLKKSCAKIDRTRSSSS